MVKLQLHHRLSDYQVKDILCKYLKKDIKAKQARAYLSLGKSQFFDLVKKYKSHKGGIS